MPGKIYLVEAKNHNESFNAAAYVAKPSLHHRPASAVGLNIEWPVKQHP